MGNEPRAAINRFFEATVRSPAPQTHASGLESVVNQVRIPKIGNPGNASLRGEPKPDVMVGMRGTAGNDDVRLYCQDALENGFSISAPKPNRKVWHTNAGQEPMGARRTSRSPNRGDKADLLLPASRRLRPVEVINDDGRMD